MPAEARLLALILLGTVGCEAGGGAAESRGDRYSARGLYADAAVEYGIALEAAGEDAPAELRLKAAELALRSKDFNAATRMFDELIQREPDYAGRVRALYYLHARRWSAQGDTFAMLRAIEGIRARDSTASLGALYYAFGDAAFARPDYEEAIAAYLMGLARHPAEATPEVFARLADAYEQRRDCPAALEYLGRFLELTEGQSRDEEEIRYRMGSCSYRLAEKAFANADYQGASEYLQAVLRSGEPPHLVPEALLMMARIEERAGNRNAAMDTYRRVVEAEEDRQSPVALRAFRRLKQLEFGFPLEGAEREGAPPRSSSPAPPRSR